MNIKNKFKLKQEVYIWGEVKVVCAVKVDTTNVLDYQLWSRGANTYERYEEWQIEEERKIWFNDGK